MLIQNGCHHNAIKIFLKIIMVINIMKLKMYNNKSYIINKFNLKIKLTNCYFGL